MRALVLALLLPCAALAQEAEQARGAVLRALDKFSGDVVDITMENGRVAEFGRLQIILRECRFPVGEPTADAFAALDVIETGRGPKVFSGWMIASSPALNAMQHPRYDVWLLRCTTS